MHPPTAAFLLAMAGCAPKYSGLEPLGPSDLLAPLSVQHKDVRLDDGSTVDIAYIDSGPPSHGDPSAPPIVLVHGLSSYMGYWEYQVGPLSEERRVLALDLPGYGASGRPDAPYTPPWFAGVVRAWMDEMGLEKVVLVGHSMGGQISMTFALNWPDRLDQMVLSAPAGIETFQRGAADWMRAYWHEERALETREEELRATFHTLVFNRPDAGVERLLEERVRMAHTPAFRATSVAVARSVRGMLDYPVVHRLDQIQTPTLVVYGTEDRMIPNPVFNGGRTRQIGEKARDLLPNARLVMLSKAGHTVHHDDAPGFNQAVIDFLRLRSPTPSR